MTSPEDDPQQRPYALPERPAPLPDDLLPPVEPPTAGFLLQLFVIPAIIVTVIIAVWLMFGWIANRSSTRPEDLVARLEGSGATQWQRASELADMLRSAEHDDFKSSGPAARRLGSILQSQLDAAGSGGGMDNGSIQMRYFLARALGQFHATDGLDALVAAATTQRDPREQIVRRGAIQAMAVQANYLREHQPKAADALAQMEKVLLGLSSDSEEDLVRSESAFALGQLGTEASLERLRVLVDNLHADTRYNAATALAAHGDMAAIPTLAEMLDPEESASIREEETDQARAYKRAMIMTNAFRSVERLHGDHPAGDFSSVVRSLTALANLDRDQREAALINRRLVLEAERLLAELQGPAGS